MGGLKNQVKASNLFIKYIFLFCIETIVIMLVYLMIFNTIINSGIIYPANYYENYIENHKKEIERAVNVGELIPKNCKYAIFESDGTFVEGSIKDTQHSEVWEGIQNKKHSIIGNYYKIIERESEICIIFYKLKAGYSNDFFEKYFPNPATMAISLFILIFILNVLRISKRFGKILTSEMENLNKVTENIQVENIDFEIKPSKITEINNVLHSLLKLREDLRTSLDRQWKLEIMRREQIAALGHDLKTPITIVKGNIELLEETNLDDEQKIYVKSSLENIKDMQNYMQKLLEINKSNKEIRLHKEEFDIKECLDEIISNLDCIAKQKNIQIKMEEDIQSQKMRADKVLIKRAIVNVMENAIEYTKENSKILISVKLEQDKIGIVIEDEGEGFNSEALGMATEQFYRSDKSRNSKYHYGMGLYIVKNIIEKHGGNIILGNSEHLGGAKVEIWI